jgi:transposase
MGRSAPHIGRILQKTGGRFCCKSRVHHCCFVEDSHGCSVAGFARAVGQVELVG